MMIHHQPPQSDLDEELFFTREDLAIDPDVLHRSLALLERLGEGVEKAIAQAESETPDYPIENYQEEETGNALADVFGPIQRLNEDRAKHPAQQRLKLYLDWAQDLENRILSLALPAPLRELRLTGGAPMQGFLYPCDTIEVYARTRGLSAYIEIARKAREDADPSADTGDTHMRRRKDPAGADVLWFGSLEPDDDLDQFEWSFLMIGENGAMLLRLVDALAPWYYYSDLRYARALDRLADTLDLDYRQLVFGGDYAILEERERLLLREAAESSMWRDDMEQLEAMIRPTLPVNLQRQHRWLQEQRRLYWGAFQPQAHAYLSGEINREEFHAWLNATRLGSGGIMDNWLYLDTEEGEDYETQQLVAESVRGICSYFSPYSTTFEDDESRELVRHWLDRLSTIKGL